MAKSITYVGLDVHKDTIAVALAAAGLRGEVRQHGKILNTPAALKALTVKLAPTGRDLRFCYEAGPCGYSVQRRLTRLGHRCDVVAPALIPRKVGDRVKMDRRDAMMLAQTLRAGQLTAVWVPDEAHEAMRDPGAVARAGDARPAQGTPATAESCCAIGQFALRPLDQDASPLARRAGLCPPGAASRSRPPSVSPTSSSARWLTFWAFG